jgi:hypothetical protein
MDAEVRKNPAAYLVCYLVVPASGQPHHQPRTGVQTANQFGTGVVNTIKEKELCVPSTRTP